MNRVSEKIISDAGSRVREIEKEYDGKCRELEGSLNTDLEDLKKQQDEKLDSLYQGELYRLRARDQIDIKKELLREKWQIINDILESVRTRLTEDQDRYRQFLKVTILHGVEYGDEEIIVSPKDRELFDKKMISEINREAGEKLGAKTSLALADETRDTGGGVILRSGRIEFNGTVDQVLAKIEETNRVEMVRMLFGGEN